MAMTEQQLRKHVEDIRQSRVRGLQPIYEVDRLQQELGWTRELGDTILWGVTYGTNTLGFRQGLEQLKAKGIVKG